MAVYLNLNGGMPACAFLAFKIMCHARLYRGPLIIHDPF
jgi:hypothetical protein